MTVANMPMGGGTQFRTCPVTGFKVDLAAEKLIVVNAVTAVVFLLVGGVLALLVALTRWPEIHLLPANLFYKFLTAHGLAMLVLWIVFFEVAGLYFGSAVVLSARLVQPRIAWFAYALMLVGSLMTSWMVLFTNTSDVMFSAYVPLKAHPLFYLGIILFAVGAIIACVLFIATIVVAKKEKTYQGSLPLFTFGMFTATVIALFTLGSGAAAFIPAYLWSMGLLENFDPGAYRVLFWGFGHSAQQINLAAQISIWYALAGITLGAKPVNEKLSRFAFILYILFINLGSMHHLLVDPGLGVFTRFWNTSYFMYLAVLGSMIHAFSIPAAMEVAQRKKGFTRGLFEWLRKSPWREPGFAALVVSLIIFGFIGGATGPIIGTNQINMLAHNTWRITGHFHATVVGGTTIAFMGITYYLIPLIFRRELVGKKWATWQPYIYGVGLVLMSTGMLLSGTLGAPRRHWDITFANAAFPVQFEGAMSLTMALMGVGAVLASIGGAIYIAIAVLSLLFGQKKEANRLMLVVNE